MHAFRGIARDVEWIQIPRNQGEITFLLTFRLEIVNEEGDIDRYIPVELRRSKPINLVNEGDQVAVLGRFNKNKVFRTEKLENFKTGACIRGIEYAGLFLYLRILALICLTGSVTAAIALWNISSAEVLSEFRVYVDNDLLISLGFTIVVSLIFFVPSFFVSSIVSLLFGKLLGFIRED